MERDYKPDKRIYSDPSYKNHASDNKEFGGASDKLYGHVLLLDKEDSEYNAENFSIAVTPKALYDLKSESILKGSDLTVENKKFTFMSVNHKEDTVQSDPEKLSAVVFPSPAKKQGKKGKK